MGLSDFQWKQIKQKMKYKKEKRAKQEQRGKDYGFTLKEPYTKEELEPYKNNIPEPLYEYLINVSREMFCNYYPEELTLKYFKVSPKWDSILRIGEGGCMIGDFICTGTGRNYKDIEDKDDDDDDDDKNYCWGCDMPDPEYPEDCLKFGQVGETGCGSCYYKVHDNLYDYLKHWMFRSF